MKNLPVILFLLVALTGGRLPGADPSTIRAEIEAAELKWVAAFNRHDADELANQYLPEAQSFLPDVGILKGRDAIRKHLKETAKEEKELTQTVKTLDVFSQGDMVTETGTWQVKSDVASRNEEGTYWMVWQKDGGAWKVLREIWNTTQRKVSLADPLKGVGRLIGTWVSEGETDGKSIRASLSSKPVAGGSAILTEGTLWLDGKVSSEWADLIYFRAESKTILDIGVSKAEGHNSSTVHVLDDRIVFHETGYKEDGASYIMVSELRFDGPDKMRLTQHFGYRGGKPMEGLMKDIELKRAD